MDVQPNTVDGSVAREPFVVHFERPIDADGPFTVQCPDQMRHQMPGRSPNRSTIEIGTSENQPTKEVLDIGWIELALPIAILTVTVFFIVILTVALLIWLRQLLCRTGDNNKNPVAPVVDDRLPVNRKESRSAPIGYPTIYWRVSNRTAGQPYRRMDGIGNRDRSDEEIVPTASFLKEIGVQPMDNNLSGGHIVTQQHLVAARIQTEPPLIHQRLQQQPQRIYRRSNSSGAGPSGTDSNPSINRKFSQPILSPASPKYGPDKENQPISCESSPATTSPGSGRLTGRFTFSPTIQPKVDSPLMATANYTHGCYFRFPDVDQLTPGPNQPDDPNRLSTTATRRVRLKSISLDSDGARLVEENLGIPVQELVDIEPDPDPFDRLPTPKTPTLRQKAVSLDSEQPTADKSEGRDTMKQSSGQFITGSSLSQPTTPKRQMERLTVSCKPFKTSGYTGTGTNLQQLKLATLSVSSNNLKTLPEVLAVSDFNMDGGPAEPIPPIVVATGTTAVGKCIQQRSNILQRRGSNHSLTLTLDNNQTGGLPGRHLSASNYSLGTLPGRPSSNLSTSSYNLSLQQGNDAAGTTGRYKRNLLQRRGSNASLTLNIQSDVGLTRFNSHSSLMSIPPNGAAGGLVTGVQRAIGRKPGLLERRNSNASLTLTIQNRGLSISNSNLRGSDCSLLSIASTRCDCQPTEQPDQKAIPAYRRKFLSTESLHNISICLRNGDAEDGDPPNDLLMIVDDRCTVPDDSHRHRSASDLQPTESNESDELNSGNGIRRHRNITTKPLSPQTTSEEFKMYLANIQLLQSASNPLTDQKLTNLHRIFTNPNQIDRLTDSLNGLTIDDDGDGSRMAQNQLTTDEQKKLLRNLHKEFWDLPTNYQLTPMVFGSHAKNRYKTILPNEHSRVLLMAEPGGDEEPYINANYIKGPDYSHNCYIATQGPMPNTIYDFWLMIEQNVTGYRREHPKSVACQKIVMLTNLVESTRQKCAAYFPPDVNQIFCFGRDPGSDYIRYFDDPLPDDPMAGNFFLIRTEQLVAMKGYQIRRLMIVYQTDGFARKKFPVYHYWFPGWPDHHSPENIDVLLDMSLHLLDVGYADDGTELLCSDERDQPIPIIHCSAGIGRTGCLAAILNGLRQMRTTQLALPTNSTYSVDVLGIVCNLRLQRGGMVQNSEQYEWIHRALCLYHQRLCNKI